MSVRKAPIWLCPIYGLVCDRRSIKITDNIRLILAPEALKVYLVLGYPYFLGIDKFDFVLVSPRSEEAELYNEAYVREGTKIGRLYGNILTYLRLCHSGQLFLGPIMSNDIHASKNIDFSLLGSEPIELGLNIFEFFNNLGLSIFRENTFDNQYHLHPRDIKLTSKLLGDFHSNKQLNMILRTALYRFNLSYPENLENRLVDQIIAFESLLIGDNQELNYKLSLRTAFLLAQEKQMTFEDMKKAYSLRSKIVHSNSYNEASLAEIVPKIEDYLRQSIRRILPLLLSGCSLKEIREKLLDKNIINLGRDLKP